MQQFTGRDGKVEYLLTVYEDGTRELATRSVGGSSWGAPTYLDEIPVLAQVPC